MTCPWCEGPTPATADEDLFCACTRQERRVVDLVSFVVEHYPEAVLAALASGPGHHPEDEDPS